MFLRQIRRDQQHWPIRLILIAIIILSVSGKIILQFGYNSKIDDPGRNASILMDYTQYMTNFLTEEGLNPQVVTWRGNRLADEVQMPNNCNFVVTAINPKGWDEAAIMQSEAYQGKVQYLTRLGLADELPVFYSSLDLYITYGIRLTSGITGIVRTDPMVFAVLPQTACDFSKIKWDGLYDPYRAFR